MCSIILSLLLLLLLVVVVVVVVVGGGAVGGVEGVFLILLLLCWAVTDATHRPGHDHIKASSSWVMEKPKEAPRAKKRNMSRGPSEDTPDTAVIQVLDVIYL